MNPQPSEGLTPGLPQISSLFPSCCHKAPDLVGPVPSCLPHVPLPLVCPLLARACSLKGSPPPLSLLCPGTAYMHSLVVQAVVHSACAPCCDLIRPMVEVLCCCTFTLASLSLGGRATELSTQSLHRPPLSPSVLQVLDYGDPRRHRHWKPMELTSEETCLGLHSFD